MTTTIFPPACSTLPEVLQVSLFGPSRHRPRKQLHRVQGQFQAAQDLSQAESRHVSQAAALLADPIDRRRCVYSGNGCLDVTANTSSASSNSPRCCTNQRMAGFARRKEDSAPAKYAAISVVIEIEGSRLRTTVRDAVTATHSCICARRRVAASTETR